MPGGDGCGTFSAGTDRVGSGSGDVFVLLFVLLFALLLALVFAFTLLLAAGLTSSTGAGDTSTVAFTFAFAFVFAFVSGVTPPLTGMPSSLLPVGGCVACTGWLFGSATSPGWPG